MNRTERLIADAFEQLLTEKPLNKITVREIVERCGVNRNTFYYHFQNIPVLLERIVKEKADELVRDHGRAESLMDCMRLMVRYCTSYKRAIMNIYRSVQRESFLNALDRLALYAVEEFVDTVTEGIDVREEDKRLLIRYYKCTLIGVSLDWLDSGMRYDLLEATTRVCELLEGSTERAFRRCAIESEGDPGASF